MLVHGPDSWLKRTSKVLLCASACLFLGAVSHVAAGGQLPGPGGLGLLFAGLTVLGVVLFGGRRRRFDATTLALGGTQFGLHLALHRLSLLPHGEGPHTMAPAPSSIGHHSMAGHTAATHAGMNAAELPHAGAGHALTATMTLAHALATLGTALCVVYGERILRRLAALVLPRSPLTVLAPLPLPPEPRLPAPPVADHVRHGVLLSRSRPRRGPPLVIPA